MRHEISNDCVKTSLTNMYVRCCKNVLTWFDCCSVHIRTGTKSVSVSRYCIGIYICNSNGCEFVEHPCQPRKSQKKFAKPCPPRNQRPKYPNSVMLHDASMASMPVKQFQNGNVVIDHTGSHDHLCPPPTLQSVPHSIKESPELGEAHLKMGSRTRASFSEKMLPHLLVALSITNFMAFHLEYPRQPLLLGSAVPVIWIPC